MTLWAEAGKTRAELETMRKEVDKMRAEVAQMQKKARFQELAAQESRLVFSDAGMERRRLTQFERLAT